MRKAQKAISWAFYAVGVLLFIFSGLESLYWDCVIVNEAAGFWGIVGGLTLFPVVIVAVPFYAIAKWGFWKPLWLTYVWPIVAYGFIWLGAKTAPAEVRDLTADFEAELLKHEA